MGVGRRDARGAKMNASFIESATNTVIALIMAFLLTRYALPFWGYEPKASEALEITAMFFAIGFFRMWVIREVFRKFVVARGE